MKKLLLSIVAFAIGLCAFAQQADVNVTVCDDPCTPHATAADYSQTLIPMYPQSIPAATVGQEYNQCISIKCPTTVSASDFGFGMDVEATVYTMNFTSINLPAGLSACIDVATMTAGEYYAIRISGVPTAATEAAGHPITLKGSLTGTCIYGDYAMQMANGYFSSTGITPAGFNIVVNPANEDAAPVAAFLASRTTICAGEYVRFTDRSSNTPTSWAWNFGDETTSTLQNPVHYFATAGTYTVSLTATNEFGTSEAATQTITVNAAPAIVCESTTCTAITDQTFSTTAVPYYSATTLSYTVNQEANACITVKCPQVLNSGVPANIDNINVTALTNLPTGMQACIGTAYLEADSCTVLNVYGTPTATGTFELKISCTWNGSAAGFAMNNQEAEDLSTGIVITIVNNPDVVEVTADFEVSEESVAAGRSVVFTNTSTHTHHIAWQIENGSANPVVSTENTVTVTYATAGEYLAKLIAYNEEESESDTATLTITVTPFSEIMCEEACAAAENPTFGGELLPYYAESNLTYNLDSTVDDCVTIKCPASLTLNNITANVTNATITAFANLPEGMSYCVSDAYLVGDEIATIHFTGVPTVAGDYPLTISITASGTTTMPGFESVTDFPIPAQECGLTIHVVGTTEVAEAMNEISIYPNPATDVLTVAADDMQNITIYDMVGRVVMSKDVNSNSETINVADFAKAQYIVKITTATSVEVRNIVVE